MASGKCRLNFRYADLCDRRGHDGFTWTLPSRELAVVNARRVMTVMLAGWAADPDGEEYGSGVEECLAGLRSRGSGSIVFERGGTGSLVMGFFEVEDA